MKKKRKTTHIRIDIKLLEDLRIVKGFTGIPISKILDEMGELYFNHHSDYKKEIRKIKRLVSRGDKMFSGFSNKF